MDPFIFRKSEVLPSEEIRELTGAEVGSVAGGGETLVQWETSVNGGPWHADETTRDWTTEEQHLG